MNITHVAWTDSYGKLSVSGHIFPKFALTADSSNGPQCEHLIFSESTSTSIKRLSNRNNLVASTIDVG